jgi:hypothetical protein
LYRGPSKPMVPYRYIYMTSKTMKNSTVQSSTLIQMWKERSKHPCAQVLHECWFTRPQFVHPSTSACIKYINVLQVEGRSVESWRKETSLVWDKWEYGMIHFSRVSPKEWCKFCIWVPNQWLFTEQNIYTLCENRISIKWEAH